MGLEFEYKWRVDDLFEDADPTHPESGDALLTSWLEKAGEAAGAESARLYTLVQSALHFDTPDQLLDRNGLNLRALINYGALKGTGWLELKETVRWCQDRREALEFGEMMPHQAFSRRLRTRDCAPIDRLYQRLSLTEDVDLQPFVRVVQRRRKMTMRLPFGFPLPITLDTTQIWPAGDPDARPSFFWWFEAEVNTPDSRALDALDRFAAVVSDTLGRRPVRLTKPEIYAQTAGLTAASR